MQRLIEKLKIFILRKVSKNLTYHEALLIIK